MPQLRFDQTTGDWVVFAPLRKLRPHRNERFAPPSAESRACARDGGGSQVQADAADGAQKPAGVMRARRAKVVRIRMSLRCP